MATIDPPHPSRGVFGKISRAGLSLVPVLLVGAVILLFLQTYGSGMPVSLGAAPEALSFERTVLEPGAIDLVIRNLSPEPLTISAININSSVLPYQSTPGSTIPGLRTARLHVIYSWVPGETYNITVLTGASTAFETTIEDAEVTEPPSPLTLLDLTLIGLLIGFLPVLWGIAWSRAFIWAGKGTYLFLIAVTSGLLAYLGIAVSTTALQNAQKIGGAFQGAELVGVGAVGMFVLLDVLAHWRVSLNREDKRQRLASAWIGAAGIGLRNFGEGLVVGAAIRGGEASLGVILVLGFLFQNITEGTRLINPFEKDRPSLWNSLLLSLFAGIPAVFGILFAGFAYSQVLVILFLAVGAGAIFEGAYEAYRQIQRSTYRQPKPLAVFMGVLVGMVGLYLAVILIQ